VLTIDQNQQRVDDSEQCVAIFNRNKDEFFRRYITMDVTWLLHNTPESNRQSADWTEREEPNPKRGKTQRSAGHQYYGMGVVLSIASKKCQTIKSEYYMALLKRFNDEIKKKRPHLKKKSAYASRQCKIARIRLRIAYPFTVFSSELFLFADLKRILAGKKFCTNQEGITKTDMSKSYYKNGFEKLYDRYNRCIALERNYIE
jgi:hypothetical protein